VADPGEGGAGCGHICYLLKATGAHRQHVCWRAIVVDNIPAKSAKAVPTAIHVDAVRIQELTIVAQWRSHGGTRTHATSLLPHI
jgi:hypothetical protein